MDRFSPGLLLVGAGAALTLVACAATTTVQVICLPMVQYSPAEQQQLARELTSLPSTSILHRVVADYLAFRDADRACLATSVTGTGVAP